MKKVITLVTIMLITICASAQKSKKDEFQECYIAAVESTFNLSEEKKDKLFIKFLKEKLDHRDVVRKKIKSGEISKEEGKAQMKVVNQRYFKSLAILTDKTKREIMDFEKNTNKKCRKK